MCCSLYDIIPKNPFSTFMCYRCILLFGTVSLNHSLIWLLVDSEAVYTFSDPILLVGVGCSISWPEAAVNKGERGGVSWLLSHNTVGRLCFSTLCISDTMYHKLLWQPQGGLSHRITRLRSHLHCLPLTGHKACKQSSLSNFSKVMSTVSED